MPDVDHAEAWDVSHYKRDYSNSSRAYIDAWRTLEAVVKWWKELPPNLRQDIEGGGAVPGAIKRAQKIVSQIEVK